MAQKVELLEGCEVILESVGFLDHRPEGAPREERSRDLFHLAQQRGEGLQVAQGLICRR